MSPSGAYAHSSPVLSVITGPSNYFTTTLYSSSLDRSSTSSTQPLIPFFQAENAEGTSKENFSTGNGIFPLKIFL